MSIMTAAIGAAKSVKRALKSQLDARTPVYLSPVRRIERIRTDRRICAMTFDDGPMALPPAPDAHGGKPLTLVLLETLEEHGGKGTFDVVGDTSGNYPDTAGAQGTASWGGVAYDHYPDFEKDAFGGAVNCPELIERILSGGHQITNHTYSHILFGRKALVYGSRQPLGSLEEAAEDCKKLDDLLRRGYGYQMGYMRPPHYVDAIEGGFSAYDVCALMGYQYLAASFDGAGWLPLKRYSQEVAATWKPIEDALNLDPNALCGQIIFQKDGYNMARRTPIADGLEKALGVLDRHGYKVVTVQELMDESPFEDVGRGDRLFPAAKKVLDAGGTIVFRNNKIMPDTMLTRGALIMMLYGHEGVRRRIALMRGETPCPAGVRPSHPYSGAISLAFDSGVLNGRFDPDAPCDDLFFKEVCRRLYGKTAPTVVPMTHGNAIEALAQLI